MTGKNNKVYKPADAHRENAEQKKFRDEKKNTQQKDRSEASRRTDRE